MLSKSLNLAFAGRLGLRASCKPSAHSKHAACIPCAVVKAKVKSQVWSKEVPRRTTQPTTNADRHARQLWQRCQTLQRSQRR